MDIRPKSDTYRKWYGAELSAKNHAMLYVPKGLAHGFETLAANSEVFYMMSEYYHPECASGIRWDEPMFGIQWPMKLKPISKKDIAYRDFE